MRKDLCATMILIAALAMGSPGRADDAAHREVAQVTLARGNVQVFRDNAWHPVRIFTAVRAGEKIELDDNSQINVFFFKNHRTEQIKGAVKFLVLEDGSHVDTSHVAVRNAPGSLVVAGAQLDHVVNDQYAVGVRRAVEIPPNLVGFTPEHSMTTSPTFKWNQDEGVDEYHFTLAPGIGKDPIFETDTKANNVQVDKPLERGKTYAWRVTAGQDETDGLITVLSDKQVQELQTADAAFKKAVADNPNDAEPYLLMGARYEKEGLTYQAIDVVKQLSAHNPQDAFPHKWLADLYTKVGMFTEANAELAQVHEEDQPQQH